MAQPIYTHQSSASTVSQSSNLYNEVLPEGSHGAVFEYFGDKPVNFFDYQKALAQALGMAGMKLFSFTAGLYECCVVWSGPADLTRKAIHLILNTFQSESPGLTLCLKKYGDCVPCSYCGGAGAQWSPQYSNDFQKWTSNPHSLL